MEAKDCKCCKCGGQAVAFYPCVDPDIPSYPYCADCLGEAMEEMAAAVWPDDQQPDYHLQPGRPIHPDTEEL